jgi:hypothetical protein
MRRFIAPLAVAVFLLSAGTAMAESTVKSNMVFQTVEQRDDWIADANAALAGRETNPTRQAFIGEAPEVGPTVARMKFTLVNNLAANGLAQLLIAAGNNRDVQTGSFVRATRDDGVVLREFYW